MKVEIIVRVDGREVGLMEQEVATAEALEFEESVERLKDRVGQALLETGFTRLASTLRQPWCCGRKMVNHGKRCWTVMSQSGPVALERNRYRCPTCKAWQTRADGVICCGTRGDRTRHLGRLLCQLATLEHFTRLEQLLLDQHGLHLGHDPMMKLVHDVGGAADAERLAEVQRWREQPPQPRHWPQPEVTPQRVYVSCDGIMYCTHQTEPDPQNPGENRLIWKQMRVGCVYWQDEQQHRHKQVTWGQEEDFQSFGAALYRLACRCGYRQASREDLRRGWRRMVLDDSASVFRRGLRRSRLVSRQPARLGLRQDRRSRKSGTVVGRGPETTAGTRGRRTAAVVALGKDGAAGQEASGDRRTDLLHPAQTRSHRLSRLSRC